MRPLPFFIALLYAVVCGIVCGSQEQLLVTTANVSYNKANVIYSHFSVTASVASVTADRSLQARVLGHALLILRLTAANAQHASARTRRHTPLPTPLPTPAKALRDHPAGFFRGIRVFNKRPIAMGTDTEAMIADRNSTSTALIVYRQQQLFRPDTASVQANTTDTEEASYATTSSTKADTASTASSGTEDLYKYAALILAMLNIITFAAMGLHFAKRRRGDGCVKNSADPFGDAAYRFEAVLKRHNWNVWTVQEWEYTQEEQESFIAYLELCVSVYEKTYGSTEVAAVPESGWWAGVGPYTCRRGRVADLLRHLDNLYNHFGPAGLVADDTEGQIVGQGDPSTAAKEDDKEEFEHTTSHGHAPLVNQPTVQDDAKELNEDYANRALIPVSNVEHITSKSHVGGEVTHGSGQFVIYTNEGRQLVARTGAGALSRSYKQETGWWAGVGPYTCRSRAADLLRQLDSHYGPAGLAADDTEGQVQDDAKELHADYANLALIPVSNKGRITSKSDVGGEATDGSGELVVCTNVSGTSNNVCAHNGQQEGTRLVARTEPGAAGRAYEQTSSQPQALPDISQQGIALVITFTESRFVEEAMGIVTEHISAALGQASAAHIWHLFPEKLIFAISFTRRGPTDALRLLAYMTRLSDPGFVAWMPSHDAHELLSRMLYGVEWGPDDLAKVENLLFMDRPGTGEDLPVDDPAKWHIVVVEMCQAIHAPSRPGIFKQIRARKAHMVKDTPGLYIVHFADVWIAMDFYNEVKHGYKWQSVFHQAAFPTDEAYNTISGLHFSPDGTLSEADLDRPDVWEAVCYSLMPSLDKRPTRSEPFGDERWATRTKRRMWGTGSGSGVRCPCRSS